MIGRATLGEIDLDVIATLVGVAPRSSLWYKRQVINFDFYVKQQRLSRGYPLITTPEEGQNLVGFLPKGVSLQFSFGATVKPVADFDEVARWVDSNKNSDGFFYPPEYWQARCDPDTLEPVEEIPGSRRPAALFPMPASHVIDVTGPFTSATKREYPTLFLMHLLGYLYGIPLQFHDWWFTGRVPVKPQHHVAVAPGVAEAFVSTAYQTWSGWSAERRDTITKALYLHARVPSYDWDWERFAWEYSVTDALWSVSGLPKTGHAKRITQMCNALSIPIDAILIQKIVDLRNNLIHEVSWGGKLPFSYAGEDVYRTADHLRRLNQRVIPAILGHTSKYVGSQWWQSGAPFIFD